MYRARADERDAMTDLTELVRLEDPAFYLDDPWPVLQRLRREEPVFYYEPLDMWVVSRYEDVRFVGRSPEIFGNHAGIFFHDFRYGNDITRSMFFNADAENPGFMNPPRHNDIRKIVAPAFAPRILSEMRERVRAVCRDLLSGIRPGEPVNWSRQVAEPLPLLVIAILMGLPLEEYDRLKYFSDEIIKVGLDASPEEITAIGERLAPIGDFFEGFLAQRDANPTLDLMTILQEARRDGQISTATVQTLLSAILTAGNETTRNTINGAIIALAGNPEQMALLVGQPDLAKSATEEFLRYVSPVRGFGRTLRQDVEMRGKTLRAGQRALNFFMSGNRDEEVFENPEAFDLRPRDKANVAFGFGQHFCIGAAIARMEIAILFEELIARFSKVELVATPEVDRQQLHFNAWENIQVVFS